MTRSRLGIAALAMLTILANSQGATLPAQGTPPGTSGGEWPSYHGGNRSHHYSPLAQITAANFNSLEVAWRLKTGRTA